jgi:gliding motility-associated-like protein
MYTKSLPYLKLLLICVIIIRVNSVEAQNLLKNPSFEGYSQLPDGPGQISRTNGWSSAITSPDYFHEISFGNYPTQPQLGGANQGFGYVGFVSLQNSNTALAESILQDISANPLQKNRVYRFKAYVKRTMDGGLYAQPCSQLSVYGFTNEPNALPTNGTHISTINGAVELWTSSDSVKSESWQLQGGCFMAPEHINYVVITQARSSNCESYIFIDDVSLELADTSGSIVLDTSICENEPIKLERNEKYNGWQYGWSTGSRDESINANDSGTYWVTHYDSAFCVAHTDSFIISVTEKPIVALPNDTQICSYDTITLMYSSPIAKHIWNSNSTDSIYHLSYPEKKVVLTALNQCFNIKDSIEVAYLDSFIIDLGPDRFICEEEIITLRTNEPNKNHLWQDGSTLNYYRVEDKGEYSVLVHDVCFQDFDSTEVRIVDRPFKSFWIDTTLCLPIELTVNMGGVDSFILDNELLNEDIYTVTEPGSYKFESYYKGCQFLDSIRIIDNCNYGVFIPNAFTPGSNDDLNPIFKAYGESIEYYNLRIFNRWGQLIFQSSEIENGWDGTFKDSESPNGIYVYVLSYKSFGNPIKTKTGNITLIR